MEIKRNSGLADSRVSELEKNSNQLIRQRSSPLKFTADILPVPFNRPRFGSHKQVFDTPRYANFKTELGYRARLAMHGREIFTGAIKMKVTFYKPMKAVTSKQWGDVDNLLKAVLDALNKICYEDDSQVVELTGAKKISDNPKIIIQIEEV